MCEYEFRNGGRCKEKALPNSKYCVLHVDLPEDEETEEFKRINELKEEEVREKKDKWDFYEGSNLFEINFYEMVIEGNVNFKDVVVIRNASFDIAKIDGNARFLGAKINLMYLKLFCLIMATWLFDLRGMSGGISDKEFLSRGLNNE